MLRTGERAANIFALVVPECDGRDRQVMRWRRALKLNRRVPPPRWQGRRWSRWSGRFGAFRRVPATDSLASRYLWRETKIRFGAFGGYGQRAIEELNCKSAIFPSLRPVAAIPGDRGVLEAKRLLGIGRDKKQKTSPSGRLFGLLTGIIDKIRRLKEERQCFLAAMKECTLIHSELSRRMDGLSGMAVDATMKEVRKVIRKSKPTLVKSVKRGDAYRTIVFLLIGNVTLDELASGRHMVYRNRTSMMGSSLKALFHLASDELVSCGYHTRAESDEWKKESSERLKNMG
jgi:hypothetical protein